MADTSTRYKMNVRSPYYVVVTDEGKPTPPEDDDISDEEPDVPDEYQQPDTLTENVSCGEVVNIGEDVGTRIFRLDAQNRTGNVTIDYDVSIPVRITGSWNGNDVQVASGDFIGDSQYQSLLEAAGYTADDMTLASGRNTGTLTVNKTAETPAYVNVTVEAPLRNDDYNLTFNCPSTKTRGSGTLPATPDGTRLAYNNPVFLTFNNPRVSVVINGTTALNQVAAHTGSIYTPQEYAFVITDNSQIGNYNSVRTGNTINTTFIDKSTYLADGWNTIEITTFTNRYHPDSQQFHYVERGGIFHNGNTWKWATQSTSGIYDHTYSPEGANGVYAHSNASYWGGDHQRVVSTYRWYEESGSSEGSFSETYSKSVYDRSGNLINTWNQLGLT